MSVQQEILDRIPHRPPFLWIDTIVERSDGFIRTQKQISNDLDVFAGHYPDQPIMPGVLLCEAIFQTGALLMSFMLESRTHNPAQGFVPVLTRIENAKFKRPVFPGDQIEIEVSHKETIGSVSYMRGAVKKDRKKAVHVDFSCALTHGI